MSNRGKFRPEPGPYTYIEPSEILSECVDKCFNWIYWWTETRPSGFLGKAHVTLTNEISCIHVRGRLHNLNDLIYHWKQAFAGAK